MKKLFALLVAAVMLSGVASAKTWTNYIGVGLGIPVHEVKAKDAKDISQSGFMFDFTYIGVHANGFTAKGGFGIGGMSSKDIEFISSSSTSGVFADINFGLGYSFIRTEKALFGACAMFEYDFTEYKKEKTVRGIDYTNTFDVGSLGIGADVFGVYNLGKHFGLFANLGIRYIFGGKEKWEFTSESGNQKITTSDDTSITGKYSVTPTVGLIWHF